MLLVARLSVREAVGARALRGLALLTAVVLGLFALASAQGLDAARAAPGTLTEDLVGSTLLGTAAFAALLLGSVVAVFLAHGAVRGDAERGLLQPLLVRPVGRGAVLLGRLLGAVAPAAGFTAILWLAAVAIVRVAGGWPPDAWVGPGLGLVAAVVLVAITATALSTVLPALGTGIVTLALVGLGFTVGLLAQLAASLDLQALTRTADAVALALPFEALYRHVLFLLGAEVGDLSQFGIAAGPFGGAREASGWYAAWVPGWAVVVGSLAVWRARRLDL